jgi:hypothetical protein
MRVNFAAKTVCACGNGRDVTLLPRDKPSWSFLCSAKYDLKARNSATRNIGKCSIYGHFLLMPRAACVALKKHNLLIRKMSVDTGNGYREWKGGRA